MTKSKISPVTIDGKKPKRRFLNRFSFAQKFTFICFQFVICLGLVLYLLVRQQNQDIHNIAQDQKGLEYFRPIMGLFKHIAEHQQTGQRFLMGDTSLENVLTHLQQRITEDFTDLIEVDQQLGPSLFSEKTSINDLHQNSANPSKLKQEWDELNANFHKMTPEQSLTQHAELFSNLRSLAALVGDSSTLVLGEDLTIYYLTSVLFLHVPELQLQLLYSASLAEKMTTPSATPINSPEPKKTPPTSKGKGAKVLPSTKAESHEPIAPITPASPLSLAAREDLAAHVGLIEYTVEEISRSLWKASQARKNQFGDLDLKAAMEDPMSELSASTANFLSTVKKGLLRSGEVNIAPGVLTVSSTSALNESFQFSELGTEQLENVLTQFYESLAAYRRLCLLVSLSLASIVLLSCYTLLRAMLSPLRSLVAAAEQLAKGNLGVRVDVAQSDEIAQVGIALNKMAASIEEILEHLQHAGVELTTSTTEIASAAKEQETTIVQQETATKQIAVTAKEISATASEFASYIHEVTRSAEETSTLAATGKEGLAKLKNIMKQMVDATTEIADKLSSLNEKTGVITGVITTITKVADRTNLLSLNAAIEAHKLGAKGGSFGVIATEIRRLADQTAFATLDIEKVVHQMVSAVSTSVEGVAKFSEDIRQGVKQANSISGLLTKIIAQVQQQTVSFESVNQGMETQSSGAKQITDSIEELSEAAQQSTTSIRQFHVALAHLSSAIKDLQSTVARLQHEPTQMPPRMGASPPSVEPSHAPPEPAIV